jgi:hypothetical protein
MKTTRPPESVVPYTSLHRMLPTDAGAFFAIAPVLLFILTASALSSFPGCIVEIPRSSGSLERVDLSLVPLSSMTDVVQTFDEMRGVWIYWDFHWTVQLCSNKAPIVAGFVRGNCSDRHGYSKCPQSSTQRLSFQSIWYGPRFDNATGLVQVTYMDQFENLFSASFGCDEMREMDEKPRSGQWPSRFEDREGLIPRGNVTQRLIHRSGLPDYELYEAVFLTKKLCV